MKRLLSLILIAMFCVLPINFASAEDGYIVMRQPVYNMADSFYSNITKVSKNSLWGICDTNGYPITGYNWEAMGEIVDSYIPAKKDGLWGYISPEGTIKIPYQFLKAENFSGDIARVLTADNQYAYINRLGNIVINSPFDYSFTPSEGLICGVKDGLYGYCDLKGNIVIEPQFQMGFDFHDGYAAVKSGESWGYIKTSGAYLVRPTYTYASDFSGGFAVCSLSTGYGIIDSSGIRTSPFTFDYIGECDDTGRFPAKKGDISGYIDSRGQWILKTNYDFCYNFTEGVARVFSDNFWGYIDEQGNELVAPLFADCGEYRNGRAFYSMDGITYGFLTFEGVNKDETDVIAPSNPALSDPQETQPEKDDSVGTYEEIIDVSDIENIPTFPSKSKCISMRIGSPYALKLKDAKRLTAKPALIEGVTMVPLRDVVEYLGGKVGWDEENQRITISYKARSISLTIDSKIYFAGGIPTTATAAPRLIDGITMIPLRSIATSLGCDVEWIPETQNINIYH